MNAQRNKFRYRFALLSLAVIQIGALIFRSNSSVQAWQDNTLSAGVPRRVNIPLSTNDVTWAESAIFWFGINDPGENEQGDPIPGRNYTDVRVVYTSNALHIQFTVVDYYLWWNTNPQPSDDLTQYDAVAIYLDTNHDRAATPQNDDFTFLMGARHYPNHDVPDFRRQGRGTGAGWDDAWTAGWMDDAGMQWECNPGPNSNTCGIDYGWFASFTIPWTALGLSAAPDEGTLWGLGATLYDRDDQPPAGSVAPESWPENFNADSPITWGDLHFGYADYQPPSAIQRGTTIIRAVSTTDNTVEDAWMGGGGTCSGGHEGGSELNHGDDANLFVGSETAPTHFPCFNKSFLRFSLDSIPPGKEIISATLTLHHWGNAGEAGLAQPSWVSLFTITDPWDEMVIHWNNAPLAQENISAAWIYPLLAFPGWPGIPYDWDATQAVAEAYAEGRPASIAIYGSDTEQHSSKYLKSSETGDWNVESRPKLTVVWGDPLAEIKKQVAPSRAGNGDTITYTLNWVGSGQSQSVIDTLPAGLSDPGTLEASSGTVSYDAEKRQIIWTGTPDAGRSVSLTYTVTVQVTGPIFLTNTATLAFQNEVSTSTATLCIDCYIGYLPGIFK
jgi:hypothetical protein